MWAADFGKLQSLASAGGNAELADLVASLAAALPRAGTSRSVCSDSGHSTSPLQTETQPWATSGGPGRQCEEAPTPRPAETTAPMDTGQPQGPRGQGEGGRQPNARSDMVERTHGSRSPRREKKGIGRQHDGGAAAPMPAGGRKQGISRQHGGCSAAPMLAGGR